MNQKKTILIAVMVNAGLLVVLFISALTTSDESGVDHSSVSHTIVTSPQLIPEKELLSSSRNSLPNPEAAFAMHLQEDEPKPFDITHRLPPPEPEKAPKIVPVSRDTNKPTSTEVTVKKGDSLAKIAKAHNTTVEEITKLNRLSGSFLKIGQILKIPEGKGLSPKQTAIKSSESQTAMNPEYYTVKSGDSPWGIAMKHHIKMEDLLKLNNLDDEKARRLKPGDRLRIR